MHIRLQVVSRDGEIEEDNVLDVSTGNREKVVQTIRELQGAFSRSGYDSKRNCWWADERGGAHRFKWFIEE